MLAPLTSAYLVASAGWRSPSSPRPPPFWLGWPRTPIGAIHFARYAHRRGRSLRVSDAPHAHARPILPAEVGEDGAFDVGINLGPAELLFPRSWPAAGPHGGHGLHSFVAPFGVVSTVMGRSRRRD